MLVVWADPPTSMRTRFHCRHGTLKYRLIFFNGSIRSVITVLQESTSSRPSTTSVAAALSAVRSTAETVQLSKTVVGLQLAGVAFIIHRLPASTRDHSYAALDGKRALSTSGPGRCTRLSHFGVFQARFVIRLSWKLNLWLYDASIFDEHAATMLWNVWYDLEASWQPLRGVVAALGAND